MEVKKNLYKGYSSFEFQRTKSFSVTDIDLVKLDLLNHIYTKKGERVMMPEFGTRIPEMLFEPLDDTTLEIIEEDLMTVFDYDPRVRTTKLQVLPLYDTNTIRVIAELFYIEFNIVDNFNLNIELGE